MKRIVVLLCVVVASACAATTKPKTMATLTTPNRLVAGMSGFEVTIRNAAGAPIATLNAPTAAVTCAPGTVPPLTTVSFLPTDAIKVYWIQSDVSPTNVCVWTGPSAGALGLSAGSTYTATILAISDMGLRGGASTTSNPFGLAPTPGIPASVRVSKDDLSASVFWPMMPQPEEAIRLAPRFDSRPSRSDR